MTDPSDWIKKIVPPDQVTQMESKADKIIEGESVVYEMSVMMRQSDMIEAVRAGYAMRQGDHDAWMLGTAMLMGLLHTMEEALRRDDVNIWE